MGVFCLGCVIMNFAGLALDPCPQILMPTAPYPLLFVRLAQLEGEMVQERARNDEFRRDTVAFSPSSLDCGSIFESHYASTENLCCNESPS